MAIAFLTGITGQDGSYLAELLLEKGYEVHGLVRPSSPAARPGWRLGSAAADRRLHLHYGDLEDSTSLRRTLFEVAPQEVYHLAGQSHVGLSFELPEATGNLTALGTVRLLEILRALPVPPRFFHASSSEVFGQPAVVPQEEATPFLPVNPYGCAKAYATQMVRVYRTVLGLYACNGILYNHESPRRGEGFVTQKICRGAAAIKLGRQQELVLGDLDQRRDWGHARDYTQAMWLMLQQKQADDYVLATGQTHRVEEVVAVAFGTVGLDWRRHVRHDPGLVRRGEPRQLVGNATKARQQLGWQPQIGFEEMIREMTAAALAELGA